jgi:sugar transferase
MRRMRGDAAVLLTMPGWLAVGYPVAVPVALNAGGEHRLRTCLRVSDEIPHLAAFAALPIVVLLPWIHPAIKPTALGLASVALVLAITKFRTMTAQKPDADWPVSPTRAQDRAACRARLISMICPQFLNMIRGQMSLIGPRHERPHFT